MANTPASREAQNPLILRSHRIMDAFAKSNDERDFYLNRVEGFLIYVDLDKTQEELDALENELENSKDEYYLVPKLTFYETKKIMEGFIAEKIYDIDTKEKLLDIIQSKEARENFLEFISDHHAEFEKWQQYYQERSRIRIIEWLRQSHFQFVFEEDLEMDGDLVDKLKRSLFDTKIGKDLVSARKTLWAKAKTYYSTEALNPRPKRGRPPKQATKVEVETHISSDVFLTVPASIRPFLFTPEITNASATFSAKFEVELDLLMPRRSILADETENPAVSLQHKMAALRNLSSNWLDSDEEEEEDEDLDSKSPSKSKAKKASKPPAKKSEAPAKINNLQPKTTKAKGKAPPAKATKVASPAKPKTTIKDKITSKPIKKAPLKSIAKSKKPVLRSIVKANVKASVKAKKK
jgi:hypothetical protein